MQIFLSSHTLRVGRFVGKGKNRKLVYQKTDRFDGSSDIFDSLKIFLSKMENGFKDDQQKKYLKTTGLEINQNERIISGVMESGIYGLTSNLKDVDTDSVSYKRKANDADVLPFFFLFSIPKGRDEGLVILQRLGQYGITMNIGGFFEKYFRKKHSGYGIEINTLVTDELVKRILEKSTIKKLRCVKYSSSTDRFDGLDGDHKEISGNIEISLSAYSIPLKERLTSFFNNKTDLENLIELKDFNFSYDTIKLEVEENGSIRTLDLGNFRKLRNYIDVTDLVSRNSDGNPEIKSIRKVSLDYSKDIIKRLYHE